MTATIGVAGFGRCGTSMVMRMLDAGGVPIVGDAAPGSYEITVDQLKEITPTDVEGVAVKILELWRWAPLPAADWRFVWLDRDAHQQARSAVKLMAAAGSPLPLDAMRQLRASYTRDRPKILTALRQIGPVTVMEFERVLGNPRRAARTLAGVVGDVAPFDQHRAASAVLPRQATCQPDMRIEQALIAAGSR